MIILNIIIRGASYSNSKITITITAMTTNRVTITPTTTPTLLLLLLSPSSVGCCGGLTILHRTVNMYM